MVNYKRLCTNGCDRHGSGTPLYLMNPKKGDKVKCPKCGAEYEIGMRPFLKRV